MTSHSFLAEARDRAAGCSATKMRILFIDRTPDDAQLEIRALRRAGLVFDDRTITSLDDLDAALDSGPWSAVICDYDLGTADGLDALRRVREHDADLPFLLVSGTIGEERISGVVGVSHDLTALKEIETKLREQQEQLAVAHEIARLGSWEYDCATGERHWSDSVRRLWGFGPGFPLTVEAFYERMDPADRERIRALSAHTYRTFEPVTTELRMFRDGELRTFATSFRFSFDDEGKPVKGIGVMQDVTEWKQAEEEVRRRAVQQTVVANLGQLALTGASTEFLLEQAVAAIHDVLGTDFAAVARPEGDGFVLTATAGSALGGKVGDVLPVNSESQIAYTLRTQQAVIMADARNETRFVPSPYFVERGIVSGISVPILTSDGAWAVLGAHTHVPRAFVPHDVDFLRSIATLIGQAIERSRADAALRTRARQQSAIAKLGRMILTSINDEVFERACELLMFGIGADYAFVSQLTSENTLSLRAGHVWTDLPQDIPISSSLQAGQTILTGEPVVVDDYAKEERFETYERTVPYGILSGVMVPIASSRRTFGVLSAQSRKAHHFHEDDIDFVQALANMLAEAIEREAARRTVEESEHRYGRIFDGATEIIFTIDPQGRFVAINSAFEAITGWPREEWLGRSYEALIVPEDRRRMDSVFHELLQNGSKANYETRLLGKDRIVWVEVASFAQTQNGSVVEVYGFARDVTETRRATAERERVTRNLELLLESTVEGIFTLDLDGRCTMINRAAAEILQRRAHELLGRDMHDVVHPQTRDECVILDVIRFGTSCTAQNEFFTRSDGTMIPVAYSAAPIIDNGVRLGVVVTFTDLSERRKLEAKLEQANRVSSLGRLAATVAHEFNNVLMGIAPFVEVVRRAPSPHKVASALDHIANSVRRGRRITQDILRFTQPAEPVRATVDVDSWLHGVVIEARSVLSPQYSLELDLEPIRVEADANQLHQIFMNLILNARDAMPDGGPITITARREPADARFPFGAVENPSRYAHFTVRDEGIGMSEETLRRAFEPLFTTKKSGTGLGLAVTHQVVLRHGGEIFIESAPGAGTTFHLFLPLAEESQEVSIPEAGGEQPQDNPVHRVLLVEDDPSVSAGLATLLQFEGFHVELAATGAEAIEKVRRMAPDVVLLDVGLPDMDGQSVYAAIAAMEPTLPVVFSTGHADRGRLEELLAKPNVTYLLKPYDTEALLEALSKVMNV